MGRAAACTCSKFRDIAEICLYARAAFTKRASLEKFLSLCQNDLARSSYVHDLELLYSTQSYDFLETQPVDLCSFPCLRSFISESPFCNAHDHVAMKQDGVWQADMVAYLQAFAKASLLSSVPLQERPLSNLRSRMSEA
jgi:hypothetical protein